MSRIESMGDSDATGPISKIRNWGQGLSFLVIEFLGGTKGVRDRFAVGAAATDTVISYFRSFLFSRQDPYPAQPRTSAPPQMR